MYAKFRCTMLRIKKVLGIFRELKSTRTTRVVFRDAFGSNNNVSDSNNYKTDG